MKASNSKRKVGDLGEADFQRWCAVNDLVCVKAVPDRMGWDYFVEFNSEIDENVPLDRQNDLKKAFTQIKATDTPSKMVRGKLSAFKRLVDSDLPAFIVHIDYSGQDQPRRARLLHIGSNQIEAVLRRVRLAEKSGRIDLHNITISLPLDEAVDIAPNGGNLREQLLGFMPTSNAEYIAEKDRIRRSCGYHEGTIKGHITFPAGVGDEALVDLVIGKTQNLQLAGVVIDQARFGISLEKDIKRIESAVMTVDVCPSHSGSVSVTTPEGATSEMQVQVFVPGGIPDLPKELFKVRLVNDFLEILMGFVDGKLTLNYRIDPTKPYPLEVLSEALKFGSFLEQADSKFKINMFGVSSTTTGITVTPGLFHDWGALHEFTEFLAVAMFRHRRGTVLEVTLDEVNAAYDAGERAFTILRPGLDVTITLDRVLSCGPPQTCTLITPVCISFQSLTYYALVKTTADRVEVKQNRIRFVGGQPHIIEERFGEEDHSTLMRLRERAYQVRDSLNPLGHWVIMDLDAMACGGPY